MWRDEERERERERGLELKEVSRLLRVALPGQSLDLYRSINLRVGIFNQLVASRSFLQSSQTLQDLSISNSDFLPPLPYLTAAITGTKPKIYTS